MEVSSSQDLQKHRFRAYSRDCLSASSAPRALGEAEAALRCLQLDTASRVEHPLAALAGCKRCRLTLEHRQTLRQRSP